MGKPLFFYEKIATGKTVFFYGDNGDIETTNHIELFFKNIFFILFFSKQNCHLSQFSPFRMVIVLQINENSNSYLRPF